MKNSIAIAFLLSLAASTSFAMSPAQPTPAALGAQVVAEHDAAYAKAHPSAFAEFKTPAVHKTAHKTHRHPNHKTATKPVAVKVSATMATK